MNKCKRADLQMNQFMLMFLILKLENITLFAYMLQLSGSNKNYFYI